MRPARRYAWLLAYLDEKQRELSASGLSVAARVDILDRDFVDAYADATGAACKLQMFGAHSCPQLGRDLGALHRAGYLKRTPTGLPAGDAAMGFPKWVYSYSRRTSKFRERDHG
jgi:hypothetical protein